MICANPPFQSLPRTCRISCVHFTVPGPLSPFCTVAVPAPPSRSKGRLHHAAATAISSVSSGTGTWQCTRCTRQFYSQEALAQHTRAKHEHEGAAASTSFGSDGQRESGRSGRRCLKATDLSPPVSKPGHWVPRTTFPGTKSFGAFQCPNCGKRWLSAHSYTSYQQGCQRCERKSLPVFMWVNTGYDDSSDEEDEPDPDKPPHDSARCEACRAGVCRVMERYYM